MTSAGNEGHSFPAGPVAASVRLPMSPPSRHCRRYNPRASPEYQEGEPCRGRPQVFRIKSGPSISGLSHKREFLLGVDGDRLNAIGNVIGINREVKSAVALNPNELRAFTLANELREFDQQPGLIILGRQFLDWMELGIFSWVRKIIEEFHSLSSQGFLRRRKIGRA